MKKATALLLLLVCVSVLAGEAEDLVDASHKKLHKKDYEGAVSVLKKAIELDPGLAIARNNLGLAYFYQGKIKDALREYSKAIEISDNETVILLAYFNRANAYRFLGEYDKSIADLGKVVELRQNDKEAYFMRGWNYLARHDYKKAEADFKKAIEIHKSYVQPYNYLGIVHLKQNDFKKAVELFSRALELTPDDQYYPDAYACRGQAYLAMNDLTRAIIDFSEILDKDPKSVVALELRGDAYFLKGSFERAARDYNKAARIGGAAAALCLKLFNTANNLAEPAGELNNFQRYASRLKGDDWLTAAVRFYQGKVPESDVLNAAKDKDKTQENENLCRAYYYIGAFHLGKKDKPKAKEYFQEAISTGKKYLVEYVFARWELQGIQ